MSRERDIAYGRHSLIPECCIKFYVEEWETEWKGHTPYGRAVDFSKWMGHYVPCPKCLGEGNLIRIRQCLGDCGRECWRDF
jgi:hypothetical protein